MHCLFCASTYINAATAHTSNIAYIRMQFYILEHKSRKQPPPPHLHNYLYTNLPNNLWYFSLCFLLCVWDVGGWAAYNYHVLHSINCRSEKGCYRSTSSINFIKRHFFFNGYVLSGCCRCLYSFTLYLLSTRHMLNKKKTTTSIKFCFNVCASCSLCGSLFLDCYAFSFFFIKFNQALKRCVLKEVL